MSRKKLILIFFFTAIIILAGFGFPREASATYYATGTLISTNLLNGVPVVTSIDSFFASTTIPANTTLSVQFATSGAAGPWYDDQGVLNASTSVANGTSSIDLSGLGWSGANFYYKMYFNTSDTSATPVLEEIRLEYTSNTAPTSGAASILDMDDTDNIYAQRKLYTASSTCSDVDGFSNIDYCEFRLKQGAATRAIFRYDEDTDTFSVESGSTEWDLDGSSTSTELGNDITVNWKFTPQWDATPEDDLEIELYVLDAVSAEDTDTAQSDYVDVVTDLVTTFSLDDDRGDINQSITASGTVTYLSSSLYPPDAEFTSVSVYDSANNNEGTSTVTNGDWSVTFNASTSVGTSTYNLYIDMADADYTDGEETTPTDTFVADQIKILTLSAVDTTINIGIQGTWYATAELEYDNHGLGPGDSFTLSGYTFNWDAVDNRFEATSAKNTAQTVTIDAFDVGSEATYGITTGNINNLSQSITWQAVTEALKVPGQLAPPSRPEEGFRFLINGGPSETENPIVTLEFFGGPDTAFVEISNFPDFRKSIKESYQKFKTWNLCQGKIICLGGKYTIYVKFFTPWGTSSEVPSASIIYRRPILKIPEIIKKITEIFKPELPEFVPPEVPIEELVPEEAPSVFQGQWPLLTYTLENKPFVKFTLAPLPIEFQKLAEKFPELGKTFDEVGVQRLIDIEKLEPVKLTLPGLTERIGLPTTKIEPGKFALPQGVPVAELSAGVKEQIPSEIVFVKTGGKLIDFSIALSVTEKGKTEQRIATISGKPLQLIVKPDQPVKSIKGYVVFKSTPKKVTELEIPLESLLASVFFSNPIFAREHNPKEIEEVLVLMEFEYTDPDGDGIYTADIQAPLVEGEYEIITVMDYEDPELDQKEIRLIAVVDPEGYVYEKAGGKETRIPGAIVSLFWLNPETKQYELWPAGEYHQENPQATDVTGKYSFLVPPSLYYLKVEAPGYLPDEGKPFQVQEGSGIHLNIELKTKLWYLKIFDWKTILLILVIFLLFYNFYRDKIRERKTINL